MILELLHPCHKRADRQFLLTDCLRDELKVLVHASKHVFVAVTSHILRGTPMSVVDAANGLQSARLFVLVHFGKRHFADGTSIRTGNEPFVTLFRMLFNLGTVH